MIRVTKGEGLPLKTQASPLAGSVGSFVKRSAGTRLSQARFHLLQPAIFTLIRRALVAFAMKTGDDVRSVRMERGLSDGVIVNTNFMDRGSLLAR